MRRTLQLAVIADDITGAADTGVQFCPAVGPVFMASLVDGTLTDVPETDNGVAGFTNTRHADPATAADIVGRAAKGLSHLEPGVLYKKIDSCLRGNLGAELDAMLLATGCAASFVVPALPQQGRTTVNDRHLIHGVPVAVSEIGRDPRCPVRESRLSVLLSAQSRLPVGHVGLGTVENGAADLARQVGNLLDQGCRHITFDARETVHLEAIAGLARHHFTGMLLAGSAGLAGSLARMLTHNFAGNTLLQRPRINRWLLVCGSASRVLAEQVATLVHTGGWVHWPLDPLALSRPAGSTAGVRALARQAGNIKTGGVVLSIRPIPDTGAVCDPDRVVRGLAAAAADLVDTMAPQGVLLSGGDTAEAFWQAIGARALRIREEVLPGIMRGEFIGGWHDGLPVVTKAGAFGHADTLNQLIKRLT